MEYIDRVYTLLFIKIKELRENQTNISTTYLSDTESRKERMSLRTATSTYSSHSKLLVHQNIIMYGILL